MAIPPAPPPPDTQGIAVTRAPAQTRPAGAVDFGAIIARLLAVAPAAGTADDPGLVTAADPPVAVMAPPEPAPPAMPPEAIAAFMPPPPRATAPPASARLAQTRLAQTRLPRQVLDRIGLRIARAATRGDRHVTLPLEPETLGRLAIDIGFSPDGAVDLRLEAEEDRTRELMQEEKPVLEEVLAMLGVRLGPKGIRFARPGGERASPSKRRQSPRLRLKMSI